MLMLRRIAAQHFATGLANPEVYPAAIYFNALFTTKYGIGCFRNQVFHN
jgi:hypothetical protein